MFDPLEICNINRSSAILFQAASRYLFRPITAMEEENKDSIIQRLGLESPT